MKTIYLDNAATAPLSQSTKDYLIKTLEHYGNPSSLYNIGQQAKQMVSDARKAVAKFINTDVNNIYFTSGGSASNTLGIKGYYQKHNCCILYSPIAHKSVKKCVETYKYSFPLKVDNNGFIDVNDLKEWLNVKNHCFVVIDYANSEIGTIQKDIKQIINLVHFYNGVVYLDCTGSISTVPLDVKSLDVDIAGFSAHKIGGLKGCGVLYKKENIELEPIIYGTQEKSLVGGTENTLGIVSLGKALEELDYSSISSKNRDYVYNYIINNISDSYLVGASIESMNRLPHNLYACFRGIEGEALTILLDMNGIQVSTGSACNGGNLQPSHTLTAIGMNKADIHSCIRLTFSGTETRKELKYVCEQLKKCVEHLRTLIK